MKLTRRIARTRVCRPPRRQSSHPRATTGCTNAAITAAYRIGGNVTASTIAATGRTNRAARMPPKQAPRRRISLPTISIAPAINMLAILDAASNGNMFAMASPIALAARMRKIVRRMFADAINSGQDFLQFVLVVSMRDRCEELNVFFFRFVYLQMPQQ